MIEHAYRDRKIADDVCAGKFTENGVTLELGLDPHWLSGGLSHDEEWQIAWIKFYFGLDLAAAFAETAKRGSSRLGKIWLLPGSGRSPWILVPPMPLPDAFKTGFTRGISLQIHQILPDSLKGWTKK